ncbi:hypothetical protein FD719_20215, partial [Photobacterium damselae subsp. damselae]|uniref:hypothetical protein n=1 Tax=Photobacterium damselae TaxID=38293 RepID=UPI0010FED6FC
MKNVSTVSLPQNKTFFQRHFTKRNAAIVLTCAICSGSAFATGEAPAGPTAALFDPLKTAILVLIGGLGASAITIMVSSQGWQMALGIA